MYRKPPNGVPDSLGCGSVHGVPISDGPDAGGEVIEFDCRQVGSALVVCSPNGASKAARVLANALPDDPDRTVVVADFPPDSGPEVWTALVAALRKRGPIRLAVSRAGSGELGSPAQWLSDQLKVEVVAPDGVLLPVPGGSAFVIDSHGAGCWYRFRPGHPPDPMGSRFPAPEWEPMTPGKPWASGRVGVAEPIPAGLWMHAMPSVTEGPSREHARPVFALPCRPEVLTIVLGGPEERPVPPEEIRALLTALPMPARTKVRIAPYGVAPLGAAYAGEPLGQIIADLVGERIAVYSGLPVLGADGIDVVAYDAQGQPSWRPFTTELGYWPRTTPNAMPPSIIEHRPPVGGLVTVRPGVYQLSEGAVVELVNSGLWIRDPAEPPISNTTVRALPMDPLWARITVGVPGMPTSPDLFAAATELYSRLDPDTQRAVRFVFSDASQLVEDKPAEPAPRPLAVVASAKTVSPAIEDTEVDLEPVADEDVDADFAHGKHSDDGPTAVVPQHLVASATPREEPETEVEITAVIEEHFDNEEPFDEVDPDVDLGAPEPVAEPEPEPEPIWHQRSTQAERDWVRHTLGGNYEGHAARVLRLIAKHPGLRTPEDATLEAVVTDLVAAQMYLLASEQMVDSALRAGELGQLMPFVRCVVSGLRRMPPFEGAVLCYGKETLDIGDVFTEKAFLNTASALDAELPGPVEYVVWSVNGRKVDGLGNAVDRVVFLPDTRFRVVYASKTRLLLVEDDVAEQSLGRLERAVADREAMSTVEYPGIQSLEWPLGFGG
jgi:hypothetical protein